MSNDIIAYTSSNNSNGLNDTDPETYQIATWSCLHPVREGTRFRFVSFHPSKLVIRLNRQFSENFLVDPMICSKTFQREIDRWARGCTFSSWQTRASWTSTMVMTAKRTDNPIEKPTSHDWDQQRPRRVTYVASWLLLSRKYPRKLRWYFWTSSIVFYSTLLSMKKVPFRFFIPIFFNQNRWRHHLLTCDRAWISVQDTKNGSWKRIYW